MRYLTLLLLSLLFLSCSNEPQQDLPTRIDHLISEDNYVKALDLLNNTDSTQTNADLELLREKTHLNYGIYLEYRGPEGISMRDRMTSALEQYIAVLKINPKNEKARSEIKQIMNIYSTMPDKSPGEEILAELRDLGFEY